MFVFKPVLSVLSFFSNLVDCAMDARKMHTEMMRKYKGF